MIKTRYYLLGFMLIAVNVAYSSDVPLRQVHIDVSNKAALQRGARIYTNFCAGCHTLKYLRYNRLARDLEITDFKNQIDTEMLYSNLIFTQAKVHEPIENAMPTESARQWFGVEPPDLSLIARVRKPDWLFTYLTTFYKDPDRPFGTNNWVYPDVAMPNVLINLQGNQLPLYREEVLRLNGTITNQVVEDLLLISPGLMHEHEFNSAMRDLVTFLVYVSDPSQLQRVRIGIWVLLFLGVLLVVIYGLKRLYWKNVP